MIQAALLGFAALQPSGIAVPSEAEKKALIQAFNADVDRKLELFTCIYESDISATHSFLAKSRPYSFASPADDPFNDYIGRPGFVEDFAKCTLAHAKGNDDQQILGNNRKMTIRSREFRDFAVQHAYLQKYPEVPKFGKLKKVRREWVDYGENSLAINKIQKVFDCAAKRAPRSADWIVRNLGSVQKISGSSVQSNKSAEFDTAFAKCGGRGSLAMLNEKRNNSTGILADSLLRLLSEDRRSLSLGETDA